MKDFESLLPHILQFAPGCAAPTAYFGIRQAAIDFCERTRLWRYADDFDITGTEDECITTPYGSVVHEIELVQWNGIDLEPKPLSWLDTHRHGWRTDTSSGQPAFVTQTAPDTLRIVPGQAGHLTLNLWLKPSDDATELPDFMIDSHRKTLAAGALAYILAMPNQPFSSDARANAFGAVFNDKLESLMRASGRGQQRGRIRSRGQFM